MLFDDSCDCVFDLSKVTHIGAMDFEFPLADDGFRLRELIRRATEPYHFGTVSAKGFRQLTTQAAAGPRDYHHLIFQQLNPQNDGSARKTMVRDRRYRCPEPGFPARLAGMKVAGKTRGGYTLDEPRVVARLFVARAAEVMGLGREGGLARGSCRTGRPASTSFQRSDRRVGCATWRRASQGTASGDRGLPHSLLIFRERRLDGQSESGVGTSAELERVAWISSNAKSCINRIDIAIATTRSCNREAS